MLNCISEDDSTYGSHYFDCGSFRNDLVSLSSVHEKYLHTAIIGLECKIAEHAVQYPDNGIVVHIISDLEETLMVSFGEKIPLTALYHFRITLF